MGTPESAREPRAYRILNRIGASFCTGALIGSTTHFIRGIYSFPAGARLSGGAQFVGMHAPKVGGRFAAWSGIYSIFDCILVYARHKEDPWNSILAGAASSGFLSVRKGFRVSGRAALVGGAAIALVEGAFFAMHKFESDSQNNLEE